MATTTNYGWTTPDDTALVKDGAAAIRTLGSSIDTSLNTALGTKKAGMVLLNTTSFSGVSSQNVTSVFSATYTNYKILLDVAGSTTLTPVSLRLLSGTTPNTSTNYNRQVMFLSGTTFDNERNTGLTSFAVGRAQSSGRFQSWAEIVYPFASENTQVWSFIQVEIANPYFRSEAGTLSVTTSYDGFQIFPVAGTITGSVSVYGYSK